MSLQTPSDVKVKEEDPVEVDSSPPDSPDSFSSMSDSSREPIGRRQVQALCKPNCARADTVKPKSLRPHWISAIQNYLNLKCYICFINAKLIFKILYNF